MDLIAITDFNLVARHGGFARAARASGRPKATLSRRVAELENQLQLRLFERGSRNIKLTEEGMALYERTSTLLTELDETVLTLTSGTSQPRGRLRISAPLLFCQLAMGKLAAEFAAKYPQVQLEVTSNDHITDMIEEGYDLVIRVNPAEDENLYGRLFLNDRLVVVASPAIKLPSNQKTVPVIVRSSTKKTDSWDFITDGVSKRISVTPVLRLSSMIMIHDAVCAGAGAALLPLSLVDKDIKSGKLNLWGESDTNKIGLWTLYPSRRLLNARVSAFLEHLKQAFPLGTPQELAAYIEG
ncbi:LysR family transcriptional regulator [Neptunicella marina]|uniref:LysR family transcriptional regulator n=1 Tax=Neptunicella marina TaxID=2125989 RepID=A0A8J6IUP3_9ALTE|nr:LysR family transcriptional regulator [Neptunicella marina]MBC3765823.1 LysR family transcriptional regulator [Neptunicella marina]